ncbi:MAG: hypothetical protein K2P88_08550 [Chitinophagaceae bacterium]|uniref:hypothetical protein n=1 Tax=unclassified Paraflavitalea TaxID=2798305 RepID=UPI003D340CF6|nr:hypothetical protein [Chitinophagaceae bacterium]
MEQPKIGTRIEETRIEEIQRKNKRRNKGNTGTRMRENTEKEQGGGTGGVKN